MILFDNGLIKLNFDPSSDILFVDMPNVDPVFTPDIARGLAVLVEHVRNYDIKRLVIDARKTQVEVSEEDYATLLSEFMENLAKTRIRKIARIVTSPTVRENVLKKVYGDKQLPFELQSFTDIAPAVVWLKQ